MSQGILRGQVYWVALDPVRGSEIAKTRPGLILSTEEVNNHRRTVIVLPLTTTQAPAVPPLVVAIPSLGANTKARIEHIRAVDKSRLQSLMGDIDTQDWPAIEDALRRVLKLPKQ
jgi:mRNA interferase MazF